MEVIVSGELEKLYTTGKSKKLPPQVVTKFFATVQKIENAETIRNLLSDRGLNFEKLKGTDKRHSMRLSDKYRLEADVEWLDEKKTVGQFTLVKISNHYE